MEEKKSNYILVGSLELCQVLDVSISTVFKLRKEGLPHYRHGKLIRYNLNEVFKWMKESKHGKANTK